jgi:hypothetical protein
LALPTTHAFEGMRKEMAFGVISLTHFAWGMGLNLAYFAFALFFFHRMFELARRRGQLGNYPPLDNFF